MNMKLKRLLPLLLTALFLLGACSTPAATVQPTPSPKVAATAAPTASPTEAPTPSSTVEPTPTPAPTLQDFLGSDIKGALKNLAPLVEPVAYSASFYTDGFDGKPGDEFAWSTIYTMLNGYTGDSDKNVKKQDDGSLVLTADVMKGYFADSFSAYADAAVPAVYKDYTDVVKYDAKTQAYTILRADGEERYAVTGDAALGKNNDTIIVSVAINDGSDALMGTAEVELVPSGTSRFAFTVKAVTYTAAS